ncbi:ImcF-related family protein [Vogesella amnigena]|uniref:ImcF-related family protein n=1 Tax=Vogesella amnigena TaxID=1507449 RepID=A0ABV7TT49_9NEIS
MKAWLMLVQPAHADAGFLAPRLAAGGAIAWRQQSPDRLQQVARFYAAHLAQHPEWALPGNAALLQASRQTLSGLIDVEQASDTLYRQLLADSRARFPDLPLATLTGGRDPRGLWRVAGNLPGVYTRQAYDGFVKEAISRLSQQTASNGDWVLGQQAIKSSDKPADIAAALQRRYFADFAHAWQGYLNRIQWQPAANLSASAEQLRVYADAQQSPLAGLMQTIVWQAQAGAQQRSLADSLVDKAKNVFNSDDADPAAQAAASKAANAALGAPLAEAFGPLLRLAGNVEGSSDAGGKAAANAADSLSLQRYLDRASATRLKLDQVNAAADPDAYARQLAQNLFQGRASELVDARDYAQLVAASLGSAWAGMGQNLLLEPLDQGWRTLMRPAAASLNSLWDASVVRPFNSSFAGRYPFNDSDSDASLAELARFIGPQGNIQRFAGNELAGILQKQGDQWVPNPLYAQALRFDVDFLNSLNKLAWLAGQLYAEGDLKTRFSLMALGHPKVTDSQLQLDGQSVRYFNQRPVWQNLAWPGEPLKAGGTLLWESLDGGLRKQQDSPGPWGFIRLLAKAKAERLNNSDWRLVWPLDDGAQLRYTLRTQAGSGPLALLQLDHFKLPARVFDTGGLAQQAPKPAAANAGKAKP